MKVFNRIVVSLLLAGLLVLGIFVVLYGFGLAGYSLSNLPQAVGLPEIVSGIESLVSSIEAGEASAVVITGLLGAAVVGLVLLFFELRPGRPRRVRLGPNRTYATRRVVKQRVRTLAGTMPGVLQTKVKVGARRGIGARAKLKASVRPGEGGKEGRSRLKQQMNSLFEERGVPVSKFKLKVSEAEPQETKTRVK